MKPLYAYRPHDGNLYMRDIQLHILTRSGRWDVVAIGQSVYKALKLEWFTAREMLAYLDDRYPGGHANYESTLKPLAMAELEAEVEEVILGDETPA